MESHPENHYHEEAEINGFDIICRLNNLEEYELYLPQIVIGKEPPIGAPDQVIPLSEDPDVAQIVFAKATALAQEDTSLSALYRDVEAYVRTLGI